MTRFVVMTAAAAMPSSCKGRYGRAALVEVEGDQRPAMISVRAKGVVRILELRDKLNVGGPRSAFVLAVKELEDKCAKLNAEVRP